MKNKKRVLVSLSFALVLGLSSCACYDCEKELPVEVNGVVVGTTPFEQEVCGRRDVKAYEGEGYKCVKQ